MENTLVRAQREAIAYYQKMHDNETNKVKKYLWKKEIERSEKDLNDIIKPKITEL